jgi:hypothetical protein
LGKLRGEFERGGRQGKVKINNHQGETIIEIILLRLQKDNSPHFSSAASPLTLANNSTLHYFPPVILQEVHRRLTDAIVFELHDMCVHYTSRHVLQRLRQLKNGIFQRVLENVAVIDREKLDLTKEAGFEARNSGASLFDAVVGNTDDFTKTWSASQLVRDQGETVADLIVDSSGNFDWNFYQ